MGVPRNFDGRENKFLIDITGTSEGVETQRTAENFTVSMYFKK